MTVVGWAIGSSFVLSGALIIRDFLRIRTMNRPLPDMLSNDEKRELLKRAEGLWADLQSNDLGGYSGVNRPFYIRNEMQRIIEAFGRRDTGLTWSKDELDAAKREQKK